MTNEQDRLVEEALAMLQAAIAVKAEVESAQSNLTRAGPVAETDQQTGRWVGSDMLIEAVEPTEVEGSVGSASLTASEILTPPIGSLRQSAMLVRDAFSFASRIRISNAAGQIEEPEARAATLAAAIKLQTENQANPFVEIPPEADTTTIAEEQLEAVNTTEEEQPAQHDVKEGEMQPAAFELERSYRIPDPVSAPIPQSLKPLRLITPKDRLLFDQEAINARLASFKETQQRFQREREEYYAATIVRARATLPPPEVESR
jgi:hypothetical protein